MGEPVTNVPDVTAEITYLNVQEPSGPPTSVLLYYAVLAYPGRDERQKRRPFFEAMAAMRFKEFAIQLGSREGIPQYFSGFKKEKMFGGMNLGWKRVEKRIHAGEMGWCICLNGRRFPYPAPTSDGKVGLVLQGPRTVNEALRAFFDDQQSRPDAASVAVEPALANITHRIWAESLPVLHIAMAHPITIKIVEAQVNAVRPKDGEVAQDLFNSIHEPAWLRKSLEDAEGLKVNLPQWLGTNPGDPRRLGFRLKEAVSLLPTEDPSLAYRLPL